MTQPKTELKDQTIQQGTVDTKPEDHVTAPEGAAHPATPAVPSTPASSASSASPAKPEPAPDTSQVPPPKKPDPWDDEDDDWSKPVKHDPQLQEIVENSAKMQMGQAYSRKLLPLCLLVMLLFASSIGIFVYGFMQDKIASSTDPAEVERYVQQLGVFAGPLVDWGVTGCALWFACSCLMGGLALIVPVDIFYTIGRSNLKSKVAGTALKDLVKAEFYKYALVVLLLGFFLKETDLVPSVLITSFAVLTLIEMGIRAWTLPKPDARLQEYWQHKKQAHGAASEAADAAAAEPATPAKPTEPDSQAQSKDDR